MKSRAAAAGAAIVVAAVLAACGSGSGETSVAEAPADPDAPATGTLRVFAYGDTVPDEMLDPFREANPDVDLEVATFDSNKAAAAKLAGGFEADVVEVCTDEMEPLLARDLIRPLDPEAVDRASTSSRSPTPSEVRNENGEVLFVPASAGPHGLIVNTDELGRRDRLLPGPVRPGERGPGRARGDAADRDRGRRPGHRPGRSDEPDRRGGRAGEAEPAREPRQLPRVRRIRRLDGQPLQVRRGRARRRRPRHRGGDDRRRPAGRVGRPDGGRALVGVRAGDHLEGGEHGRRLQAHRLLRLAGGAGDLRRDGLRRDEPGRARAARREVHGLRRSEEPRRTRSPRPSPRTPTSTTAHGKKSSPSRSSAAPVGAPGGGQRRPGRAS